MPIRSKALDKLNRRRTRAEALLSTRALSDAYGRSLRLGSRKGFFSRRPAAPKMASAAQISFAAIRARRACMAQGEPRTGRAGMRTARKRRQECVELPWTPWSAARAWRPRPADGLRG